MMTGGRGDDPGNGNGSNYYNCDALYPNWANSFFTPNSSSFLASPSLQSLHIAHPQTLTLDQYQYSEFNYNNNSNYRPLASSSLFITINRSYPFPYPCYVPSPCNSHPINIGKTPLFISNRSYPYPYYVPSTPYPLASAGCLRNNNTSSDSSSQFKLLTCSSDYNNRRETQREPINKSGHYRGSVSVSVPLDVVLDILRRLPAKCIVRFRSVCKLWNSFTQEEYFLRQHLNTKKIDDTRNLEGLVTLDFVPHTRKAFISYFIDGYHKFEISHLNEHLHEPRRCRMSNSCNGLVCVYGPRTAYLVNPSIREVLVLPHSSPASEHLRHGMIQSNIGLGQKMSTGEYFVIRFFCDETGGCKILKLGSGSESKSSCWRSVEDAPHQVLYNHQPVYMNGAIHWLAYGESWIGVSFDTERETFDVIPRPSDFRVGLYLNCDLVELGGKLCVTSTPSTWGRSFMWVLNDRRRDGQEKVEWTKLYEISFLQLNQIGGLEVIQTARPLVIRDGKIVWRSRSGRFDLYDPKTRSFLKPLDEPQKYPYTYVYPYKDSLVSPLAIQRKNLVVKELASEDDPSSSIQYILNSNVSSFFGGDLHCRI